MKKILIVLCSVMILLSMAACGGNKSATLKEYSNGEIVLQLPSDCEESFGDGDFEYTLGNDNMVVYVSSITREELKGYGWDEIDLEMFTEQVIGGEEVLLRKSLDNCEIFSYTAQVDDEEFYYLIADYENNDKFYIVNFVCYSSDRNKYENTFLDYAGKVTFR